MHPNSRRTSSYDQSEHIQYTYYPLIHRFRKVGRAGALLRCDRCAPDVGCRYGFCRSPSVIEALQTRVGHGVFGYTLQSDAYQAAVISWMERRHNWKIQSDWMVFTPGIVPALSIAVQQFTSPGDAVVIQTPVYPPFYDVVKGQGRELVTNPLLEKQGQYTMDLEHLEASFQVSQVKMLILCSPHNPVGRVWTREELEELASLCLKYNVLIVSDEIHADLIYERGAHTPLGLISEEIANCSIICTAPSKTFNIPGLCTSNIIIANTDLRERFALGVRTMGLSSISTFGAAATEAAYDGGEEWLDQCLTYIRGNMEYVQQYITEHLPGINLLLPEATYLLWVDFRGLGMTHAELTRKLLHEAKLAFNDGAVFGAESAYFYAH